MDNLYFKKYGVETFHIKNIENIYDYVSQLNYYVEKYLNREILNLDNLKLLLEYYRRYLEKFKMYYLKLNKNEIKNFPAEFIKFKNNVKRLKLDLFYNEDDEFFIFIYIFFMKNIELLYNSFFEYSYLLEYFYKFDKDIQSSYKINLNLNDKFNEQIFYVNQPLENDIKEYFKKQLENSELKNELYYDLDNSYIFPTINCWMYAVANRITELSEKELKFNEKIKNIINSLNFEDLKYFQKYKKYSIYQYNLLKELKVEYLYYINYFNVSPLKIYSIENLLKNLDFNGNYFDTLEKTLLKTPLDGNIKIKIYLYEALSAAVNIESAIDLDLLLNIDEIHKAKIRYIENKIKISMKSSIDFDIKKIKDINNDTDWKYVLDNGLDLYYVLLFNDIINKTKTLNDVDDLNLFEKILIKLKLIDDNIIDLIYKIENNLINTDLIISKIDNYAKTRFGSLRDPFLVLKSIIGNGRVPNESDNILNYNKLTPDINENKKEKYHQNIDNFDKEKEYNNKIKYKEMNNKISKNSNAKYGEIVSKKIIDFGLKNADSFNEIIKTFPAVLYADDGKLQIANEKLKKEKNNIQNPKIVAPLLKNAKIIKETDNGYIVEGNKKDQEESEKEFDPNDLPSLEQPEDNNKKGFFEKLWDKINKFSNSINQMSDFINSKVNDLMSKVYEFNNKINDWINDNINEKIQNFINNINNFLSKYINKINDFFSKISDWLANNPFKSLIDSIINFISALLCALKALLCLIGMILNIGSTISDTLENFKNAVKSLINSAFEAMENFVDDISGVIDSIADAFGIKVSDLCSDSKESFKQKLFNEINNEIKKIEDEFMTEIRKLVDEGMQCKLKAPTFNFGTIKLPRFGLYIPKSGFAFPHC